MMLRSSTFRYLVLCSALWVISLAKERPPQSSGCDSTLSFSSSPPVSSSEGNGNIHSRSLSPWTWRSSTMKNRIPSTIWEAECSTAHCSSTKPGQSEETSLNSVPIQQSVLVLRRQDGSCYSASYLTVTVGCTCVRARSTETISSDMKSPIPQQR